MEDSRKIDAVLTLGTVQRRAIERHAQQDIGKAKVKDKYMAASDKDMMRVARWVLNDKGRFLIKERR